MNGVRNLATGLAGQGQDTNVRTSDAFGVKRRNPGRLYQDNSFFDFIQATIESRSTKLLASPTLILQENADELREDGGGGSGDEDGGLDAYTINSPIGRRRANEGVVRVGTNVITNVEISAGSGDNSFQTCELELSTAGLVLGARVQKIDDNGFVTFSLSPSVSAVTDSVDGPPACTSEIAILSVRRLDTGAVRVRDGQTLILTGVISDVDLAEVRKWPILGDLPLVGQFFRASNNSREKRELVIMVTPRIIDDSQGGAYGYGYQPGTRQSRDFLRTGS